MCSSISSWRLITDIKYTLCLTWPRCGYSSLSNTLRSYSTAPYAAAFQPHYDRGPPSAQGNYRSSIRGMLQYSAASSACTTSCDGLTSHSGRVRHPARRGIRKCKSTPSPDPAVTREAQPPTRGPHSAHASPILERAAEPGYGTVRARHGRLLGMCAQHEHCGAEARCGVCWSCAAGTGKGQWEGTWEGQDHGLVM